MAALAHEHFCSQCYGRKTNGVRSGWWRCTLKPCTKLQEAPCSKHDPDQAEVIRRGVTRLTVAAILILLAPSVHAQTTYTISWDAVPTPVQQTPICTAPNVPAGCHDKVALPVTHYNLRMGGVPGQHPVAVKTVIGTSTTFTVGPGDLQPYYFVVQGCSDPKPAEGIPELCSPESAEVATTVQACAYALSAPEQSFQAAGGTGNVAVTTTAGCQWTASSSASWVTVTPPLSLTGPGSVTFAVAANTASGRVGLLTLAGKTFAVNQAGVSTTDPCAVGGVDAVSIFVTRWEPTSGKVPKPGALMRVNYQLASKTPIRELTIKANGVLLKRIGGTDVDLTADGGMWFNAPSTAGTYTLLVGAKNAVCPVREVASPVSLVVR